MISNWALTKARSSYHFDTTKIDSRWDCVQHLGYISPHWHHELDNIVGKRNPVTWRTRGRVNDDLQRTSQEHDQEDFDLEQQGYGRDFIISDLTYDIPAVFDQIAKQFALEKTMARVHVQHPGQVWNLHIDKLEKWMPQDPTQVVRYFVQLTDWQPGHFWSFGNFVWQGWRAGDVVTFDWYNVPHATANAGHTARATLQITGIKTMATQTFVDKLQHDTI